MPTFPTWTDLKDEGLDFWAKLQEAQADGKVSFVEVLQLIAAMCEDLMRVAETLQGATGAQKKQWVLDTAYAAYQEDFDIDIPYVPGFLEGPLERAIFKYLLPNLIELVIRSSKGEVVNIATAGTV